MANWANLPFDLLLLIAIRIRFVDDYFRFCLVCKSWLKVLFFKDNSNSLPSLYPMLMLMDDKFGQREFYNPFNDGGIYKSRLDEIRGKRCWGSSNGWLITLDTKHQIHLFNPLTRLQIQLPMLVSNLDIKSNFYNKIIISDDSSSGDSVVFAIYSDFKIVASTKPGAESWVPLQCPKSNYYLYDAKYIGGKFYVVNTGFVHIFSINGLLLKSIFSPWISNRGAISNLHVTYIVNLDGQLCLVTRSSRLWNVDPTNYRTFRFKVFKLDELAKEYDPQNRVFDVLGDEMVSLGNWSIFVGSNSSFSISCIEYPECKSNCIYFTDHYPCKTIGGSGSSYLCKTIGGSGSSYDTGVYNLADGTIKPLLGEKNCLSEQDGIPVWVKPFW